MALRQARDRHEAPQARTDTWAWVVARQIDLAPERAWWLMQKPGLVGTAHIYNAFVLRHVLALAERLTGEGG